MANNDDNLETSVLRESVRARVAVAPVSFVGTYVSISLMLPFLISHEVPYTPIALWTIPILILIGIRSIYSHYIYKKISQLSSKLLVRVDRKLRVSSIVNQFAVGTGIWSMHSNAVFSLEVPLFITLAVITFSIGVIANLFSDYKTFALSIPLLIGQPALFWIMQDQIGIAIGVGMFLAMILAILLVKRGSTIFRESITMRFEKDNLLIQIQQEKEKTQEALNEAETANHSKESFLAAASHDIKQPLYALRMLTDTLLLLDLPNSALSILEKQRQNINTMSEHFDSLMDLSRFQNGNFRAHYSLVEMIDLRQRVANEFEPMCEEKGLALHLEFDVCTINTDINLLLRLIRNLLSNAVRYTATGSIFCTALLKRELVIFTITDTGPGISEKNQALVFKEFFRLEDDNTERTGAGLGLAIVKNIDRELRLGLELTSKVGHGTCFSFSIAVVAGEIPEKVSL